MARTSPDRIDLSDAEKRDLIRLIQEGRPLPDRYRFLLFEDKREVELVWNGKTADVCTAVLPFQTLEHVDEPRPETKSQAELFDARGRQTGGWANKLIWGDNKLILSSLKAGALRRQIEDAGGLKLIYIDPPFDVGADFSMDIEIGGETFHKEPNLLEQIAYRDTWGRGADSFLAMMYERLVLMKDLMHPDGSIYVHCDWRVNAFIRMALSEVFGSENFRCEIVWKRSSAHSDTKQGMAQYGRVTDTIFYATKGSGWTWNQQFQPYDPEYVQAKYSYTEADGRRFKSTDLTAAKAGGETEYEWKGKRPPRGRYWAYSRANMEKFGGEGRIHYTSTGFPRLKQYLDEMDGIPLQNYWFDIPPINSQAVERLAYPTQKPEALLERILKTSSNSGDLVADFFCGSGTTAAAAEKLGRRWICTDLGKFAIHTTRKRLIQVQRELKAANKRFRAFEVLNLGRYERQAYLNVGGRLGREQREAALSQKEREFRDLILRAYKAEPLDGDGFFHGKRTGRLVVVGPINLPVGRLFVEEIVVECRKRGATRVDLLAFEFEMGLFPAVLEEARQKGIELTPKYIPADVFDKRAVDRGQVIFHDISFVEATPRFDPKNKLELRIELTDFSVYYNQGAAAEAIAALKDGKSDVLCERGQLMKVSKNKDGAVKHEVLTKDWTDWVDYWAVDFNYESRPEIIRVPVGAGLDSVVTEAAEAGEEVEYEERRTGAFIFENEWQSFRTRRDRSLDLTTSAHRYEMPGRYVVAVKVVDIFGNDTMTLVPVTVG